MSEGSPPTAAALALVAAQTDGLTEDEVAVRRSAGQVNAAPPHTGRTYAQIVRDNVFNFINLILFGLGITLISLGRYLDALIAVGVVLANTLVSLFQEVRAKRILDRLAILTRPTATVVREGVERTLDPGDIVLGDLVAIGSGDQFVVDGRLVAGPRLEVDESLLTGESDLVTKKPGDEVLSGSFVVAGRGHYVAERVGRESFANQLAARAKAARRVLTPLQRQVRTIVNLFLGIVAVLETLVIVRALLQHVSFVDTVRASTVVVALVPNGLILAIALAYALGAIRMAGKGTLVQQANAVESLSNVDVLCTDKTGTLTTNAITYHGLTPAGGRTREEIESLLGIFAASASEHNKTTAALAAAFPAPAQRVSSEAPFSSERKWSGLAFEGTFAGPGAAGADDPHRDPEAVGGAPPSGGAAGGAPPSEAAGGASPTRGTFVLGAPEVLVAALSAAGAAALSATGPTTGAATGPAALAGTGSATALAAPGAASGATVLASGDGLGDSLAAWTSRGLRVLLFAALAEAVDLSPDDDGPPRLPLDLAPLALIAFTDELRPHVRETLDDFEEAGIAVKVISGDNPQTVMALATQAGLDGSGGDLRAISGEELAALDRPGLADAAENDSVFGRVTPDQKEELAQALRDRGRYVAMIGDGVNDVVALKQANLGIAMNSGSQAARAVAGLVLMKDSFAALPAAFREGQRIRNGLQDVLEIFMVRIFGKALVITLMLPFAGFPFSPRNSSLLSFFGAGVPALVLTAWAPAHLPLKGSIFRPLARFALPPVVVLGAMAVVIHLVVRSRTENAFISAHPGVSAAAAFAHALPIAQTSTIAFFILCSLLLIPFVAPPSEWFTGGAPLRGDWRPTAVAAGLVVLFAGMCALPLTRHLFELSTISSWDWVAVSVAAVAWALIVRLIWRSHFLDRLTRTSEADAR